MEQEFLTLIKLIVFTPQFIYGVTITWFFVMLFITFYLGKRKGTLDWTDLIIGSDGKLSPDKLSHLIGVVLVTWVIVNQSLSQKLTFDILLVCLGYLAGQSVFKKFLTAKYKLGEPGSRPIDRSRLNSDDWGGPDGDDHLPKVRPYQRRKEDKTDRHTTDDDDKPDEGGLASPSMR